MMNAFNPPPFPENAKNLVAKFSLNLDSYKANYNEAEVRQEFINPFFEALGWDINNTHGYSNNYKEVLHEDAVLVSNKKKHPDYSFRTSGIRHFFCEAKKPSVKIKSQLAPALQTRRYGWSAGLYISALTDFEELAIYDMRVPPKEKDSVETARLHYFTFEEYEKNWQTIYEYLGKEAILSGSHERQQSKKLKGTRPVDEEFLKNIEDWRELLAKDLVRNKELCTPALLTETVQRLIDRIVFLRIAEDRGLETYGALEKIAGRKNAPVYDGLKTLFKSADAKYNSGLFHFKNEAGRGTPDTLMAKLEVGNTTLKEIILNTYPPRCQIEFSVVSADILGSVYEQFLGKTITISASGQRAKVEVKPEVRKAGGVYYTPAYIVSNIVTTTLAPLLKGKTPTEAKKLKVLDPACGSGSFLVAAYEYLLLWYLSEYEKNPTANTKKKRLEKVKEDKNIASYQLTVTERKEILQNNIFGLDIDATAVEVAKLSLLLKVLENIKLPEERTLVQERALPDLGNNIRCGNALIGSNFLTPNEATLFDEGAAKVNCFDWESEHTGFGAIIQNGGFNAIVGNPPYARVQSLTESQGAEVISYFKNHYKAATENFDIYVLFLEKGHMLLAPNGRLGFIIPHKFLNAGFGKGIRRYLTETQAVHKMVHFGAQQIFNGAFTFSALVYLYKQENTRIEFISITGDPQEALKTLHGNKSKTPATALTFVAPHPANGDEKWQFHPPQVAALMAKLTALPSSMGDVARKIFEGIATGRDGIYVLEVLKEKASTTIAFSKTLNKPVEIENGILKKFLMGRDVLRYQPPAPNKVVLFPYQFINNKAVLMKAKLIKENFPNAWNYIWAIRKELKQRERGKFDTPEFYKFSAPRSMMEYAHPKILMPEIANRCRLSFDDVGLCFTTKIYGICLNQGHNPNYFLGLLNSRVLWFFLSHTGDIMNTSFSHAFKTNYISPFPLPNISLENPTQKAMHNALASSVENMLALEKTLAKENAQTENTNVQKITQLRRQIEALNTSIDSQVYALYNLTPEEIAVVESTPGNKHHY